MNATVRMRAVFIAAERRCAENCAQPTQIIGPCNTLRKALRPVPAESLHFIPALFPTNLRKNVFGLLKKFRERRRRWQKLNRLETACHLRFVFRAGAKFAEDFDVKTEMARGLETIQFLPPAATFSEF